MDTGAWFPFSLSKSTAMHLCCKKKCHRQLKICLNSTELPSVEILRYLGMTLDRQFKWRAHVQNSTNNCPLKLNLLKKLCHSFYGADSTSLLRLYQTVINSQLEYGVEVYHAASATVLNKLNSIHHAALRMIIGAFRTSPITSLLYEANEWPLQPRREYKEATYYLRQTASNTFRINSHFVTSFPTKKSSLRLSPTRCVITRDRK